MINRPFRTCSGHSTMNPADRSAHIAEKRAQEAWEQTGSYTQYTETWIEVFRQSSREIYHKPSLKNKSVFEILGVSKTPITK